jgi:Zinc carboxypeptidase
MKITTRYQAFFEDKIQGRYVTLEHILPLLEQYKNEFEISEIGTSELGKKIPMIKIGQGKKIVLGWSQMHGNETTTTKAIFDFLKLIATQKVYKKEISQFIKKYTFYVIPILNPDGAKSYTRENANGVDLNRDAQNKSQSESIALHEIFKQLEPDVCLNLHDQRTIYGFEKGKPATVSFLAPAADKKRSVTVARKTAMYYIEEMAGALESFIPGQIGRYDDAFNADCVGDTFQMAGVPTILFEAGHFANDYQREETRKYICYALLVFFGIVDTSDIKRISYNKIAENQKNFKDIIIREVSIPGVSGKKDVAFQYKEVLGSEKISFQLYVDALGDLKSYFGHEEHTMNGAKILVNSQESYQVGEKVSKIINKSNNSVLFISENQ